MRDSSRKALILFSNTEGVTVGFSRKNSKFTHFFNLFGKSSLTAEVKDLMSF